MLFWQAFYRLQCNRQTGKTYRGIPFASTNHPASQSSSEHSLTKAVQWKVLAVGVHLRQFRRMSSSPYGTIKLFRFPCKAGVARRSP